MLINKKELFDFLATQVAKHDFGEEKEIVITIGSEALTLNSHVQLPCTHEEADSRMAIHIMNALEEGNNTFLVRLERPWLLLVVRNDAGPTEEAHNHRGAERNSQGRQTYNSGRDGPGRGGKYSQAMPSLQSGHFESFLKQFWKQFFMIFHVFSLNFF